MPRAYGRRAGGASHEEEIPGIRHGVVRERNDLVVGIIEAGMDLPLVGSGGRAEGRALRFGAEAAEHQDIPLASVEVGNGCAVGAAGEELEGVVAAAEMGKARASSSVFP